MIACGIDTGSFTTLSYIAWLDGKIFSLDHYMPTRESPLPNVPRHLEPPSFMAFDAPQGLPHEGRKRRVADAAAKTPTSKLPATRAELADWRLYRGLIELGVDVFWSIHSRGLGTIFGMQRAAAGVPTVMETYPRYVIRRLWPELVIPSKRRVPSEYVEAVWSRLLQRGYVCEGVVRPTVDQVDAMLCALAAETCMNADRPSGTVGETPTLDGSDGILREGWIVSP